jgi:eukaryotic-like serine/threonine-protein kinase
MSESSFGKYRLIAEIGHGGMADVFLAVVAGPTGSGFSKLTVVKRLRANLADEPEFVEMLVDEARITARLNHPNVVQTNEVGSINGQYYIAMEYLDGQPLHRIQHRAQKIKKTDPSADPFPLECEIAVIADTLAGLHHAHELADYDGTPLAVVHRDVTPQNVFITYEGQVKVVDFGIAKAAGRASETRQGIVKGKARYMAPEQAMARNIDRRADLFSVGVMLWEAATGRRMWRDMEDLAIVQALLAGQIPSSPRTVDPNIHEELDRICRKALSAKADDRYDSAEDFRLDVEQYLSEHCDIVRAKRKLGSHVVELFGDKRTELRSIIEQKLASLKSESTPLLSLEDSKSGLTPSLQGGPSTSMAVSVSGGPAPGLPAGAARPRRAASRAVALIAAACTVGGAFAAARFAMRRARAETEHVRSTSVAQASPSPNAAGGSIDLQVSAEPPTATILLDGKPAPNPLTTSVPRDDVDHTIRIEAAGHEPRVETVRFDRSQHLAINLARSTSAARPSPPTQAAVPQALPTARARNPVPDAPPAAEPAPTAAPAPPAAAPTAKHKTPVIDKEDPW